MFFINLISLGGFRYEQFIAKVILKFMGFFFFDNPDRYVITLRFKVFEINNACSSAVNMHHYNMYDPMHCLQFTNTKLEEYTALSRLRFYQEYS